MYFLCFRHWFVLCAFSEREFKNFLFVSHILGILGGNYVLGHLGTLWDFDVPLPNDLPQLGSRGLS